MCDEGEELEAKARTAKKRKTSVIESKERDELDVVDVSYSSKESSDAQAIAITVV